MLGVVIYICCWVEVFVDMGVMVFDICKIMLGLCVLEKYVVCCGGGINKCMGFYDVVMVKDNYKIVVGSVCVVYEVVCICYFDVEV